MKTETTTPTKTTTTTAIEPRAFAEFLLKVADGDAHEQLSQDLFELSKVIVAQSRAQVKAVKGSLTLKINLVGDGNVLDVSYEIDRKEPKPRRPTSVFWVDKFGNFAEHDPKQTELGFREVGRTRAAREAAEDTGAPREV